MLTARRGLALVAGILVIFLLFRNTSEPSPVPAFGSARSGLSKGTYTSQDGLRNKGVGAARSTGHTSNGGVKATKQIPLGDMSTKPLRTRLSYYFPYDVTSRFPAYIWQTWKVTPASGSFKEEYRTFEASWSIKHPGFVHEVITDDACLHLLRHFYSAVPDVIAAYEALPRAVLKADFFRYLILLARGGIYTDIDTFAIQSASEWVPGNVPRDDYGLVVGIEADPDRPDWADWYSRRIQFCQWTIQAKPGHPVLREIVARITEQTLQKKHSGTLNEDVHGVVEFTGPAVWTDIIFDFFNNPEYFDMSSSSSNITWEQFTGMKSARRVGDVVVLPITCFSPGIQTMGAGEDDDPMAMVKHYFDGTWKPESERHIGEEQ